MNKKIVYTIVIIVVLVIIGAVAVVLNKQRALKSINSYGECVAAGYPIETTPADPTFKCVTPDGRVFIKSI